MLKRSICLLLVMLMILMLMPAAVFAEGADMLDNAAPNEPPISLGGDTAPVVPETQPTADTQAPVTTPSPVATEPPVTTPSPITTPSPVTTEPPVTTQAPITTQPPVEDEQQQEKPGDTGIGEPDDLLTDVLFALDADENIVPYMSEPAPGNVSEMPTGLALEVLSSNSAPTVNETVTYTLNPTGTTPAGNSRPLTEFNFKYKYRYSVMQKVDGAWQFVVDPANQPFQENNVFSVTFYSGNEYKIDFYLLEMYPFTDTDGKEKYFSTSDTKTIYVTPTGAVQTIEQAADDVAKQCLAALPNGSQYERALWLHDWILEKCTYDNSSTGVLCGAEGVFFYGKGTCAAYRSAYKMLLDRVNIENERCTGNGHEWNVVKLDGKWYHIDVTWDDVEYSDSYYKHLYFGLTDELMSAVHSEHSPNPACPANSLEQNYFIKTGQIHTWSDKFEAGIVGQLEAGNSSFSLPSAGNEPDSTKSVLYGVAAYELSTREWTLDNGKEYSLSAEYDRENDALNFTAQDISEPETPPEEKDYSLDNVAQLHGGKPVILSVDGIDLYPDAGGSFGSVELAEGEELLITTAEYNLPFGSDVHQMYPTGMYVYSLEKSDGKYSLNRVSGLDNLLTYGGSSIRITGNKGIRMITGIDRSLKSAIIGNGVTGYRLEEYGTLLCWASEIQNGSLSLGDSYARHNYAYSRAAGTDPVFRYSGGKAQYTNVLVGFSNEQCVDDIAMRPYIKLTAPDGGQVTLYGGIVRRSIGYIAYQNRNAFSPGTAAYNYIWDIIHYVYGDKYDADYRG